MGNKKYFAWCLFTIVLAIGSFFLASWGVMALWNWIAPLFWKTAPILTFWQTVGVIMLLHIVFNLIIFRNVKK